MSIKYILCFGDSNTWGYVPCSGFRYNEKERYPKILEELLGDDFKVVEEGRNARELLNLNDDEINGYKDFEKTLNIFSSYDYIVLALGTNDLNNENNKNGHDLIKIIDEKYLSLINRKCPKVKIILVAPPIINEDRLVGFTQFKGTSEKFKDINDIYKSFAKEKSIYFISNENLGVGKDGVHFTIKTHKVLANKIATLIKEIENKN